MQKVILFYNGLEVPTRQILDSKGAIPTMTSTNAKIAIQEMVEHSQKWHNLTSTRTRSTETSDGLAAIQSQFNNLGREIKKATAPGFYRRNNINPSYQEQRQSMEEYTNRPQYANFRTNQMTIPFLSRLYHCDEEKGSDGLKDKDAYLDRTTLHNDALPQKEKDPWSFTLPCYINNVCFEKSLADFGANVSVMPFSTYTNLGLGELAHTKLIVELADRTVKHPKGIVENVLVGLDKFVFPVDFIIQEMPEDVKVPLIFGRPFLSTTHTKIDVFKRNITLRVRDEKIIFKSVKPASSLIKRVYMLSLRERMELDLEARLMGETLILNRSLDHLNGDYIKLNDLNEPLELKRDQANDLEPTIEEVDEDMDINRADGMGDVIIGNPLCREVCVKTMRFEGIITILNGNDSVTYHMVRSHPRYSDPQFNLHTPTKAKPQALTKLNDHPKHRHQYREY
ncbi:retrovirus-related pol polyprotein from transposon TNT 1-94 [Tanacetum coccineum]